MSGSLPTDIKYRLFSKLILMNLLAPLSVPGSEADFFDRNHRIINYLRLSVTDRCNLRCIYCMPEQGISFIPRGEILTYEEMLYVVRLCVQQGIRKVRLTGGEPLLRKGIISFIDPDPLGGPARRYAFEGASGEIGFIGALSHRFCDKCNRLRMTADGHLRGCLFSELETDLKTPLRQGRGDSYLLKLIKDTILNKPKDHGLNVFQPRKCARSMNSIGG